MTTSVDLAKSQVLEELACVMSARAPSVSSCFSWGRSFVLKAILLLNKTNRRAAGGDDVESERPSGGPMNRMDQCNQCAELRDPGSLMNGQNTANHRQEGLHNRCSLPGRRKLSDLKKDGQLARRRPSA